MVAVPLQVHPVPVADIDATGAASSSTFLRGDGTWATPTSSASALPLLHLRDEKASATAGGTSTSGSWQTRTLNTVKTNEITGASLASDEVTLPAGTYEIDGSAPGYNTQRYQLRLYNVTGAAALLVGPNAYAPNTDDGVLAVIRGRFTLSGTSNVRLEYRVQNGIATIGLGPASSWGTEVYADVLIRQVS